MGYCITYENGSISFKKENVEKIKEAISKLDEDILRWSSITVGKDISIEKTFEDLRYGVTEYDDHYEIDEFLGEKYGNDDTIFEAIAPYCEDGFLEFLGEDGERFRFYIEDGNFKEKYATIVWE